MITICLDESGNFEDKKYVKKFVGGVVYTGDDYEGEKKRIEEFFQNACKKYGVEYPDGIHTTSMNYNGACDAKDRVISDLKKYLKDSGKYHITMIVKGSHNKTDNVNISNIADDNIASNLYEHMVCQLISNILFYNTCLKKTGYVNLELATRVARVLNSDSAKIKAYEELGYESKVEGSNTMFYLTNQRTFKAAISTKIIESKIKRPVHFRNINVESTNYKKSGDTTPYLYLADFVCDIIRDLLSSDKEDYDIDRCHEECMKITGNIPFFWVYDDIDEIWNNLAASLQKEDFISVLNCIFDIAKHNSPFGKYYMESWVKSIEDRVINTFSQDKLNIYLSHIEYLFSKEAKDYKRGFFMANKLWNTINKYNEQSDVKIDDKYLYKTSDLIIRGYNHIGDSKGAYEFYRVCEKLKGSIDVEEYLSTVNRIVEIDANEFNFTGASEKMEESLLYLDILKRGKQEIAEAMGLESHNATRYALRGKSLSSCAQFYSFLREKEKALKYFEEALEEFGNPSVNRSVTLSYILHMAIDTGDFELYKKYSKEYFSGDDITEQFDNIVYKNDGSKSNDYMFYVYIKALDKFYGRVVSDSLVKKIQEADYEGLGFKVGSHPWELIYKYIGLLIYKNGKYISAKKFIDKAVRCVSRKGITIELINLYTEIAALEYEITYIDMAKAQREKMKKSIAAKVDKMKELMEGYENIQRYFEDAFAGDNLDDVLKRLKSKFTYMYV